MNSKSPRRSRGFLVRMPRLELGTSRLSGVRSNQLSYTRVPTPPLEQRELIYQ